MKKRDVILIIIVLALALAGYGLSTLIRQSGSRLQITVDGEVYGTYDLSKDQTIKIGKTNICRIEKNKVTMIWADCPDQTCVHHKSIDKAGGNIICLPNRVILSISGDGENQETDTVTA